MKIAPFFYSWLLITIVLLSGCGKSTPDIIPVSGTVVVDEKPLSGVKVKFVPMAPDLDGNFIASGVTDKEGKFVLSFPGQTESGCCVCPCKVLIEEGPLPDVVYEAYFNNKQSVVTRYKKSLKNRPIPEIYRQLNKTPLLFDVSPENNVLMVELNR